MPAEKQSGFIVSPGRGCRTALLCAALLFSALPVPGFYVRTAVADVPLPKAKPARVSNSAKQTRQERQARPLRSAPKPAGAGKPVARDGTQGLTGRAPVPPRPSVLPVRPRKKPDSTVNLSALIPWVMPSKAYTPTVAKVGRPGSMLCNLTFDDGPHKVYDPVILDALKEQNAKATFYLVGRNVARYPDLVKRMADEGHEIANHSWKHDNLRILSTAAVAADLKRTSDLIKKTTGKAPAMFRPPYGNHNKGVLKSARRLKMETLLWTVDSLDWKQVSPQTLQRRVVDAAGPGAVILLHSIQKKTATALPGILTGLRKKGCVFVTSSDWVRAVSD